MRKPNRLTSQEWDTRLEREAEALRRTEQAKLLDEVIGLLERGDVERGDSRLARIRRLIDDLERDD